METLINNVVEIVKNIVENSNIFISIISGFSIVILESIIPILPLAVFIAINMIAFGNFWGFIISWIATIIGCSIAYYIFRKIGDKTLNKYPKIEKTMNTISKINFTSIVIILSIPFTPAFSINIAAGLAKIPYKKYLCALLISKIFLVYFWGFIATTLIESINDIEVIIKLIFLIIMAFILSKIVVKKFNIN